MWMIIFCNFIIVAFLNSVLLIVTAERIDIDTKIPKIPKYHSNKIQQELIEKIQQQEAERLRAFSLFKANDKISKKVLKPSIDEETLLKLKKVKPNVLQEDGPVFESFPNKFPHNLVQNQALEVALEAIEKILQNSNFKVKDAYRTSHNGVNHIYLKQLMTDGMEVINGDANVNVDRFGKIISMSHSFFNGTLKESSEDKPLVSNPVKAFLSFAKAIGHETIGNGFRSLQLEAEDVFQNKDSSTLLYTLIHGTEALSLSPPRIKKGYIQGEDQVLHLGYVVEVELENNWFSAFVSENGELKKICDWTSALLHKKTNNSQIKTAENTVEYSLYGPGSKDPLRGEKRVWSSAETKESPLGWHDIRSVDYETKFFLFGDKSTKQDMNNIFTSGNNVISHNAHGRMASGERLKKAKTWKFDFKNGNLTFTKSSNKTDIENLSLAAVTNCFFWSNWLHDIFYKVGFDEASGNFQKINFGRGGVGGDALRTTTQDPSSTNNSNFATPPDGIAPKMRMYLWKQKNSSDLKFGDFDNTIIAHEFGHGVTNRLTGGPTNADCLMEAQAAGLGEGWSDVFAMMFTMNGTEGRYQAFNIGEFSSGKATGVRKFSYSSNEEINPITFASLNSLKGEHNVGMVWASILFEVYWNLVDVFGFSLQWKEKLKFPAKNNAAAEGNFIMLFLIIDGLKLQPCNPTMLQARDAILLADRVDFNGAYECLLWNGFARRGLGMYAQQHEEIFVEDFSIPTICT